MTSPGLNLWLSTLGRRLILPYITTRPEGSELSVTKKFSDCSRSITVNDDGVSIIITVNDTLGQSNHRYNYKLFRDVDLVQRYVESLCIEFNLRYVLEKIALSMNLQVLFFREFIFYITTPYGVFEMWFITDDCVQIRSPDGIPSQHRHATITGRIINALSAIRQNSNK